MTKKSIIRRQMRRNPDRFDPEFLSEYKKFYRELREYRSHQRYTYKRKQLLR